jgi:hypothetical protein
MIAIDYLSTSAHGSVYVQGRCSYHGTSPTSDDCGCQQQPDASHVCCVDPTMPQSCFDGLSTVHWSPVASVACVAVWMGIASSAVSDAIATMMAPMGGRQDILGHVQQNQLVRPLGGNESGPTRSRSDDGWNVVRVLTSFSQLHSERLGARVAHAQACHGGWAPAGKLRTRNSRCSASSAGGHAPTPTRGAPCHRVRHRQLEANDALHSSAAQAGTSA